MRPSPGRPRKSCRCWTQAPCLTRARVMRHVCWARACLRQICGLCRLIWQAARGGHVKPPSLRPAPCCCRMRTQPCSQQWGMAAAPAVTRRTRRSAQATLTTSSGGCRCCRRMHARCSGWPTSRRVCVAGGPSTRPTSITARCRGCVCKSTADEAALWQP